MTFPNYHQKMIDFIFLSDTICLTIKVVCLKGELPRKNN